MRRTLFTSLFLISGCAALPLFQTLLGQQMSVSVPSELPFPEEVTLQLSGQAGEVAKFGNVLLGALGQDSLETKLGKSLKQAAAPLRKVAAQRFKQELVDAKLFGSVVEQGGNIGMAISVQRWGIAYNEATKFYGPVLDLRASLSEPHYGVVWKADRSAAQLSQGVMEQVNKLDLAKLASNSKSYQDVMALVVQDLSHQLMEDLRQNPPKIPLVQ
jgi:hypothetical protein